MTDLTKQPFTISLNTATQQAYVKFFGKNEHRADRTMSVFEEVDGSASHWACCFPKNNRPRQIKNGAIIFMARLVKNPNDIIVYGRAKGKQHIPVDDDATTKEKTDKEWKTQYPHYIRVKNPEFLDGCLMNGISLSELMEELKADAFASTKRNFTKGHGNTDPRKAIRRKPGIELTPQGFRWLNMQLEQAFTQIGKLPQEKLSGLDWPE